MEQQKSKVYIDLDEIYRLHPKLTVKYPLSFANGISAAINEINRLPKADVVTVVKCKDCKFNVANMEKDPLDITDYSGDDIVCSYFMTDGLAPNDYCSQGIKSATVKDTDTPT